MLRDMFADVRMLCQDTGLMNPVARLMWRICRINGRQPLPQRAERQHVVAAPRSRIMPHVITQSCCTTGPGLRVPVNCIHPSPDEPGFATAEMLYIDPVACVDCGACVSACPVGAIAPDTRLDTSNCRSSSSTRRSIRSGQPTNCRRRRSWLRCRGPVCRAARSWPLTVAIVGSGPAAMYAADELLTQHGVRVNVFEQLPTPYGLVRAGVAPDHQTTKRVTTLFDTDRRAARLRVPPQRRGRNGT